MLIIDLNLTWKQHILYISLKIGKSLGIISRLRRFVPTDTLLSLYRSLIQPNITYGSMVVLYEVKLLKQTWTNYALVKVNPEVTCVIFARATNAHVWQAFVALAN